MSHHKLLQPRGSRYFILVSKLQFRLRGPQLDGSMLRRKARNKNHFFPTVTCGFFVFSAVSAPPAASRLPPVLPPHPPSHLPHHSLTHSLTHSHIHTSHTHTHSSLSHHISSLSHTHIYTYTHLITHHHSHTRKYTPTLT